MIPNLFSNVMAKLGNAILTFIATVILSRLLGAEGNGYYSLFIANTSLFLLVIGLGIENAFTYFVAQRSFSVSKIFNSSIFFAALQALICVGIAYSLHNMAHINLLNYTANNYMGSQQWLLIILYLFSSFLLLYLTALFNGEQQFASVNKAARYIQLGIIIVLLFGGASIKANGGNNSLITVFIIAQFIAPAYLIFQYFTTMNRQHRFNSFLSGMDLRQVFRFGGFALFINLIQFLAYRADLWILDYYSQSKAEVGIYGLSQKLITMYWMVPIALASITYPMLSRMQTISTTLLTQTVKIVMQVWFYLSVVTLFVAPFFTTLFFGKAFKASVNPFLIILPGALIFVFTILLSPYFAAKNLLIKNFISSLCCLLIILVLDFLLIPKYGIIGAAIGSSIGYGITGFITLYFYCTYENISMGSFFKRSKNIITDINTTLLGRQ